MSDWTNDDLIAINKAIKTGALRVHYADRDVTYRSLDEMIRIRDLIRGDLGITDPSGRSHVYMQHSKGLDE